MSAAKVYMDISEDARKKKGQRSFCLLAIAFAVTVAVLILIFILLWALVPRSSASSAASNVCSNEACISASALLQRSVDLSVDPCQDFFSFACGGIEKRLPFNPTTIDEIIGITSEESAKLKGKLFELLLKAELARSDDSEMNSMYQAVREMFLSCIAWHEPSTWWLPHKPNSLWNLTRPMKSFDMNVLLNPLIKQIDSPTNLEEFLAVLVKTGTSGLIKLNHNIQHENGHLKELLLDARFSDPVLNFHTMRFHFASEWNATVIDEVKQLFGNLSMTITGDTDKLAKAQNEVFKLNTTNLYMASIRLLQQKTNERLQRHAIFNWTHFISLFYDGPLKPNMQIAINGFSNFIETLKLLAPEISARKGSHYDLIRADALMSLRHFLPLGNFRSLSGSYTKMKYLVSENESHRTYEKYSQFCVSMVTKAMLPVVFDMFKTAYLTDNFSLLQSLTDDIEDAMNQNVAGESWIKSESRKAINDKMNDIKRVISYYELPASEMKSIFKHPMQLFKKAKDFGDIVIMRSDASFRLQLWFLTSSTPLYGAHGTLSNPFALNAFYNQRFNSMNILTGIIGTYMYNKDYPEYLLYGGIGHVIAHEISHGFDPRNSNFNGYGDTPGSSIFDSETHGIYSNMTKCLINYYNELMMVPNSIKVNGTKTVNENFSDIVGINAAFRAYKNSLARSGKAVKMLPGPLSKRLSPDQLFFVQTAQFYCEKAEKKILLDKFATDSHSPPRARVFGTMSQSKEFSRVFRCKRGDKMYLKDADKCQFW